MARHLFGTDGVRGLVGEKLTADLAIGLGRAATEQHGNFAKRSGRNRSNVIHLFYSHQ